MTDEDDLYLEDFELAEAAARVERTVHEAELAKWQAQAAKLAYESELINYRHQLDGVYSFYRAITEKSCNKLLRAMKLWHDHDAEGDWMIYLNSVGGDIIPGTAIFDELVVRSLRGGGTHEVTIKVRGVAASMASNLMQAADIRLIGPSSHMVIHEPSSAVEGSVHAIKAEADWLAQWWDEACELFAHRSNMTAEEVHKRALKQDWWITAVDAVEMGLADGIG